MMPSSHYPAAPAVIEPRARKPGAHTGNATAMSGRTLASVLRLKFVVDIGRGSRGFLRRSSSPAPRGPGRQDGDRPVRHRLARSWDRLHPRLTHRTAWLDLAARHDRDEHEGP